MRLKKTPGWKPLLLCAASALIPFCLLTCCLYLLDITPFGHNSLLFVDSQSQYVNFTGYFRSILSGENDLLYTFSKNLGGDMLSLASYYLLSPFNLIFAFSSTEQLPSFFTLVILLKLSCCGFTHYWASAKQYGHRPVLLAFSTAYALMAYNILYCWNIMWLDGVMILPLLALGLRQLLTENKFALYSFSIAYALATSFYIGYMLCITSVIFFLCHLILQRMCFRDQLKQFGRFAAASCIGGFVSSPVWLPAFLVLGSNRLGATENLLEFYPRIDFLDFTGKLVAGAASEQEMTLGMPHVFCGTLILLLVFVFFLDPSVSRRIRLTALSVVVLFLASFYSSSLDVIWHGFSPNRWFNFRFSFIFSFVLIQIAQFSLLHSSPARRWWLIPAAAALTTGLFCLAFLHRYDLVSDGLIVSICALLAAALILSLRCLPKRVLALALTAVSIFEMGANCYLSFRNLYDCRRLNTSTYYSYVTEVSPAIEYVKSLDDSFYRMEKTFYKDQNDPMLFEYNGLSHFSSTESTQLIEFMKKMGFTTYFGVWSSYHTGSTAEVDSFLGAKYVLSKYDLSLSKGFRQIGEVNGIGIYENPNVLPIAMLADEAITAVSTEQAEYYTFHNDIWSGLTGMETKLLLPADGVTRTLENLTQTWSEDSQPLYRKTDPSQEAAICWEIPITQAMPLYYDFTADVTGQSCSVQINGTDTGTYFNSSRWGMVCAGIYQPGDTVSIRLVLAEDSLLLSRASFYYEDLDALSRAAAEVTKSPVALQKNSSSSLEGSFYAEEDQMLMFTIPFDPGWKLTLDGEDIAPDCVLGVFPAVPVSAGTHTFQLRFLPTGSVFSLALSLLALLCAAFWYYRSSKTSQKQKTESLI